MKSHTMNDIDTTSPHCHFDGRSGAAKSHPHGTESMAAGNLSAQGFHRAPQVFTSHTAEYPLEMMHGRHLAIRKFSCKKDCEEMISIFSQSFSVISFRYPHAGRTFASILTPAIYVPQT